MTRESWHAGTYSHAWGNVIPRVSSGVSWGIHQVSFQWKNPDFLFKNPDILLKNGSL